MFTQQHQAQFNAPNQQATYRTKPPLVYPIRHRVRVYGRKRPESEMAMRYQIFIIEDHPIIREIYVQLIQRAPDLEVCGQAATGAQALTRVARVIPDLVLLDIALPEMNGIEVLRRLLAKHPDLQILVISGQEEAVYARQALLAGAKGYLDKLELAATLTTAIHCILNGDTYISEHMRQTIRNNDPTFLLPAHKQ
jgi:DNA-binding NarL/FixJ family response regulator